MAHLGILPGLPAPTAGDDAAKAQWIPLAALLGAPTLAFDHDEILASALALFGPLINT